MTQLNEVLVTGTLPGAAGAEVIFTPSGWLTDAGDSLMVPPSPQPVTIADDGTFSASLLATDNTGPLPGGWTWTVKFLGITGVDPFSFSFALLYANGATQDISTLAPVEAAQAMAAYLPLGGGTMTGPLTLAADPVADLQAATRQYVDSHAGQAQTYTQDFAMQTLVTVNHNLGRFPSVTVTDSAEDVVEGDVQYINLNTLTVTFSAPFSGIVYCN